MFRFSIHEQVVSIVYMAQEKKNKTPRRTIDRYYVPYIHGFIEIRQANNGFVIDDDTFVMKVSRPPKTATLFRLFFTRI